MTNTLDHTAAPFVHVVLFSLPDGTQADEAGEILSDVESMLRGLPGVCGVWCGTPADTKLPERPMVDDDYDVGLLVLCKDKAGLEEYLAHPDHVVFAKKWDSRCTVRVFDFTPGQ